MIRITLPSGLLTEAQRAAIAEDLSAAVMKVETGGMDTPGFRAITALVLDEVDRGSWAVGGRFDTGPSALVEIRVPRGALDPERSAAMVERSHAVLTRHCPALASADGVRRVWTHLIEIDGWCGRQARIPCGRRAGRVVPRRATDPTG